MNRVKHLAVILLVIVMMFGMCIPVFAATEEDIYILDMSEEEIKEILDSFYGTSTNMNIARWNIQIDNSQSENYGYSVKYYYPIYESENYNKYNIMKFGSVYYLIYYSDSTTFSGTDYRALTNGNIIVLVSDNYDDIKSYLFSKNTDRTEVTATIYNTQSATYTWLGGYYPVNYEFNYTNHSDPYYIWYKATYNTEPPLLDNDGYCVVHNYTSISKESTCIEPGSITYVCTVCNYSYVEEIPTISHQYDTDNICTVCGTEKPTGNTVDMTETNNKLDEFMDLYKNSLNPDVSFLDSIQVTILENLEKNSMYNSLLYITNTLQSLFTEDYTKYSSYKENTVLKIKSDTTYVPTPDGNSYTQSKIDWGLDNAQILDLSWYFGNHPYANESSGYFVNVDGSYAVKHYSDMVISGFLWLVFGWYVFHNLPDLISGETGQATAIARNYSTYTKKEKTKQNQTEKKDGEE